VRPLRALQTAASAIGPSTHGSLASCAFPVGVATRPFDQYRIMLPTIVVVVAMCARSGAYMAVKVWRMAVKVPNKYFNRTIQSPRTKLGSSHETRQPLRKNPAILRKTHQLFRTKPTTPEKTHQLFRTRTTTLHETGGPTARNSLVTLHVLSYYTRRGVCYKAGRIHRATSG
jgi:hypothetical protein